MTRTQNINRAVENAMASYEGVELEAIPQEFEYGYDDPYMWDDFDDDRWDDYDCVTKDENETFVTPRREAKGYPYNVTRGAIKAMNKEERRALRNALDAILDPQPCGEEWEDAYSVYECLNYIEDEEYREENMDAFRAYEAKMGEPDFDWSFYSDWHKDMFGFRPR